jgi:hypothetical protein
MNDCKKDLIHDKEEDSHVRYTYFISKYSCNKILRRHNVTCLSHHMILDRPVIVTDAEQDRKHVEYMQQMLRQSVESESKETSSIPWSIILTLAVLTATTSLLSRVAILRHMLYFKIRYSAGRLSVLCF